MQKNGFFLRYLHFGVCASFHPKQYILKQPIDMKAIFMMTRVALFTFVLSLGFNSSAQVPEPVKEGDRVLFVEIKDMDEDSYAVLTTALKDNPMFQIKQVCVPAGVLMLTIPATNSKTLEENFIQFADIARNKAELENAQILAEYDEAAFLNRCKQFRAGQ